MPGRSIVSCNNIVRDVVFHVSVNNIESSMINLYRSKAFDRVDLEFIYQVLHRVGVFEGVISWVRSLYPECSNSVCVNRLLSTPLCH